MILSRISIPVLPCFNVFHLCLVTVIAPCGQTFTHRKQPVQFPVLSTIIFFPEFDRAIKTACIKTARLQASIHFLHLIHLEMLMLMETFLKTFSSLFRLTISVLSNLCVVLNICFLGSFIKCFE